MQVAPAASESFWVFQFNQIYKGCNLVNKSIYGSLPKLTRVVIS